MKQPTSLSQIHQRLRECRKCPQVCGPAVFGPALKSKVMLIGQAPGLHEGTLERPFAHTAGKTLFRWLKESLGAEEEEIRELFYFAAVTRCFPGKAKSGKGDRPPSKEEIENCREYLAAEVQLIQPELIIAVGKVAIAEVLKDADISAATPLEDVVGKIFATRYHGRKVQVIPLPHPSGVSRWPHTEPGKSKLREALKLLTQAVASRL
jgi:uracil-DNA glycosylase